MSEREEWKRGKRGHKELDDLIYRVIGCMIAVHKELGPGFLESSYHRAVEIELAYQGIDFESEKEIELQYRGKPIGRYRLDLVVENELVVELKVVDELHKKHYAQVRSYLKATNNPIGLLINFADTN
ncbi:MAG TPA: GxxExxY protein [Thermoguttaceae bacterium]|nr:GxxExxY protein [Thermoguttaceae bacterium]